MEENKKKEWFWHHLPGRHEQESENVARISRRTPPRCRALCPGREDGSNKQPVSARAACSAGPDSFYDKELDGWEDPGHPQTWK